MTSQSPRLEYGVFYWSIMDFDTACKHYTKQKAAKVKRLTIKERMAMYAAWVEELRQAAGKDDQKTF